MRNYIMVGVGGVIGAVGRYWLGGVISRMSSGKFPYGTLVVNLAGCLLIGFIMTLALERFSWSPELRVFLTIGILGSFTTFSTFSYETMSLLREGAYALGAANMAVSVLGCLAAAFAGMALANLL
jgi:CrcB protein